MIRDVSKHVAVKNRPFQGSDPSSHLKTMRFQRIELKGRSTIRNLPPCGEQAGPKSKTCISAVSRQGPKSEPAYLR